MLKWIFRLLILVFVIIILVVALADTIIKEILISCLSRRIGLECSIENVDVQFLYPRIRIKNFIVYNSPDFGGSRFIEAPEITVEYDFERALKGEARFRLIRIDCSTINIVADNLNRVNFEELFKKQSQEINRESNQNKMPVFIEVANLSIGKVRFMNLENPAEVRELPLDIRNYIIRNISSRELNGTFLHNLILKVMLDSGKLEIRDGKITLSPSRTVLR